jgi:hypothetical protein
MNERGTARAKQFEVNEINLVNFCFKEISNEDYRVRGALRASGYIRSRP